MKRPRMPKIKRKSAPSAGSGPPTGEQLAAGPPTGEQRVPGQGGLDGVRAWLAQLDRRLRVRSWIAIGIAVLGLAAGAAGIVLARDVDENAATEEDLNEVRTKITAVEQSATQAAAEDIAGLSRQLEQLETRVNVQGEDLDKTKAEIRVANDDIEDLRNELADLTDRVADLEADAASSPPANDGGGTGGTQ